jgi:RNA-binding protein PNO1
MPAPTALLQAPAPELVSAPAPEQQDELLVDMQEASIEPSAVAPPTAAEDTDMAIDEEGRPRFAPGKDVVGR